MIGETAGTVGAPPRERRLGDAVLEVRGLSVFEPDGQACASPASISTVRKGEVVGLFGLLGAGCIEAALAIYGA